MMQAAKVLAAIRMLFGNPAGAVAAVRARTAAAAAAC